MNSPLAEPNGRCPDA